jgi:3-oxoacyl-[acyl-carrier protein] reductase
MSEGSSPIRVAVVTGVSRRTGIGFAISRRLLADGLSVLIHSWSAGHAETRPGKEPGDVSPPQREQLAHSQSGERRLR